MENLTPEERQKAIASIPSHFVPKVLEKKVSIEYKVGAEGRTNQDLKEAIVPFSIFDKKLRI